MQPTKPNMVNTSPLLPFQEMKGKKKKKKKEVFLSIETWRKVIILRKLEIFTSVCLCKQYTLQFKFTLEELNKPSGYEKIKSLFHFWNEI